MKSAQENYNGGGGSHNGIYELNCQRIAPHNLVHTPNHVQHSPRTFAPADKPLRQRGIVFVTVPALLHERAIQIVRVRVAAKKLLQIVDKDDRAYDHSNQQAAHEKLQQKLSLVIETVY